MKKSKEKPSALPVASLRFKESGDNVLVTNDAGDWQLLKKNEFSDFIKGKLKKDSALGRELAEKGFWLVDKKKKIELAGRYLKLNYSVNQGPTLFIFVLTLRCNHHCLYCQVIPENPRKKDFDMTIATAKKGVDLAFKTPSDYVRIEFQGGEPLLNWPVLKYIVDYSAKVNIVKKKNLKISLVSNLVEMDDKKLDFLLKNGVDVSCSLDGPAMVHDKNRIYLGKKSSYRLASGQIIRVQEAIRKLKESGREDVQDLNAILTVSRHSLPYYKEIIDEYLEKGFSNIFIRPLSPFGLSQTTLGEIGYTAEEFIRYYTRSLDYILKINLEGKLLIERNLFYALKKVMRGEDPNYLEMRSPCGAGIGQMAFDYDGKVYTCDEGRMAERMGYDNFRIGNVEKSSYNNLIDNEVTKTMCLASSLENHASCQACAYKPYCGICPLANFVAYGTIFPQLPNTDRCKINQAMFDYLFSKIGNKKYKAVFESWLEKR
jgi:His-Xaa-Ser system radical SAM maturase HxsB